MKISGVRSTAAIVSLALVAGCQTAPPNTPGEGAGATYTPFVDMQGVDQARYSSDLAGCRSYAQQIDPNKKAMEGMFAGILVGALVGAAVGGNRYTMEQGALAGGGTGVAAAGGRAVLKQETIIANCLAGRGYRVLSGATVPTNLAAPSPYAQAAPATAQAVSSGIPTPAQVSSGTASAPVGEDGFNVQRLAKQQACHDTPAAKLVAKGPGFESYSVACTNGNVLMYRCEYGNCRALQ